MFGLGMMELVVIAIVALLFVGPDKLPEAAKKISRGIRDFRQQTRELSKTIDEDTELGSAVRDLKSALRGDDFRPMTPRNVVKPVIDAAEDAVAAASANDAVKGGTAGDEASVGPEQETPDALPAAEDGSVGPEQEHREAVTASTDGMPVVKLAVGTVAKGEPSEAASSEDGAEPEGGKAHG